MIGGNKFESLNNNAEKEFVETLRQRFNKVKIVKPQASRKESSEMFVYAKGFVNNSNNNSNNNNKNKT